MVIEESMRLYPPAHTIGAPADRAPTKCLGHRIPAGAEVLIVPWLLHRKPSLWENPDRFDPERFAPERAAARPRFAYIPFGAGPRICIGAAFAMAEAMLILATIAQRYRLRLKPGLSGRAARPDHAAAALRSADDAGAAVESSRRNTASVFPNKHRPDSGRWLSVRRRTLPPRPACSRRARRRCR